MKKNHAFSTVMRLVVSVWMCNATILFAQTGESSVSEVSATAGQDTGLSNDSVLNCNLLRFLTPDTARFSPEVERALQLVANYDSLMVYADTIPVNPVFMPIVFSEYQEPRVSKIHLADRKCNRPYSLSLDSRTGWLNSARSFDALGEEARIDFMVQRADLVKYNDDNLPEIVVANVLETNSKKNLITLKTPQMKKVEEVDVGEVKLKHWISGFQSSIQFSQVHISENWYQGGESNLNLLSDQVYTLKYDNYKNIIFDNTIQWKLGLNTAQEDTVHQVRVSEDLFQINSKFGVKAFRNWYYTASLLFKTQLVGSYKANSNERVTEFLSPGEMNIGVGMSYQYKNEKRKLDFSTTLSPFSYDLRFVLSDKRINPADFGIDEGKFLNQYGSSVEAVLKWEFVKNMVWNSRFFYFTSYSRVQLDFENSFDFVLNRFFSTRLFFHLRYDDGQPKKTKNTYLQFKELLSIGFNYRF
ncbi:MAG: DUF3078 domain-containing protein [Coprobacter sp.]|nr:DUF3078 domain-containing protein [Coprobacter sp.]